MKTASAPAEIDKAIYEVVRRIPRGSVATYGQVAELAGLARGARRVGAALRATPAGTQLPWHRVINAQGRISLPADSEAHATQRRRLEREGVVFLNGRISLRRYGWQQPLDALLWGPQ